MRWLLSSSFWFLVLFITTTVLVVPVGSQSAGVFNEPPGERRDQTFRVLEFEDGSVNQRFQGTLRYYCTFRGKWSKERHPRDFPRSPSFSQPTLISHSNGYRMWTGTEAATLGVEALAEVSIYTVVLLLLFLPFGFPYILLHTLIISISHTNHLIKSFVHRRDFLPSLQENLIMLVSKRYN